MSRDGKAMPDVPTPDFVGAACEIWYTVNYAAYHLAYVRVYLQSRAMQTPVEKLLQDPQVVREQGQVDLIICRSHLAAFFWQLHHVFEALEYAIGKGKKEHPKEQYFYIAEKRLAALRESAEAREIDAYRNESHNIPAIIGQNWTEKGGKFLYHFLPTIEGHESKENIDLNAQLQIYFEYVVNLWLSFVPEPLKSDFPRSFSFPVTVPFFPLGQLPPEVTNTPQLLVSLEAYEKPIEPDTPGAADQTPPKPASQS
jgi:hypothetical protein